MKSRLSKIGNYVLPCAAIFGLALTSSSALAQNSASGSSLDSCRALSDPSLRLECYDRLLGTAPVGGAPNAPLSTPSAPVPEAPVIAPPPQTPQNVTPSPVTVKPTPPKDINPLNQSVEDFEQTKAQSASKDRVKSVSSEIIRADTFGYKKLRVYLKNGQVWEQTDSVQITPPRISKSRTPFAKITKASMGSHFLRVNGKSRAIKVRRVR